MIFTIVTLLSALALGFVFGKYTEPILKHGAFALVLPKLLAKKFLAWLKSNPQIIGAFFGGTFFGLLVSGTLSALFWKAACIAFVGFLLMIAFPKRSVDLLSGLFRLSQRCVVRVKNFFF